MHFDMHIDFNTVLLVLGFVAGIWRTEHLNSSIISLAKEVGHVGGRLDEISKYLGSPTPRIITKG